MSRVTDSFSSPGTWPPSRPAAAPVAARRPRRQKRWTKWIVVLGLAGAVVSGVAAYRTGGPYGDRGDQDPRLRRVYDPVTGNLTMVAFAADGSLRLDHWCYMDGERLLRMDIDEDRDGRVDRREFYGPGERLERTEHLRGGRVVGIETPGGGRGMEAAK